MTTNIYNLLNDDKIADALDMLLSKTESLHVAEFSEECHTLRNNYAAYLRARISTDMADNGEENGFTQSAFSLNDKINRQIRLLKSPDSLYAKSVTNQENNIFTRIWTSAPWDAEEENYINNITELSSEQYPLIVSAVTMALNEMFDIRKLTFLFNACESEDLRVKARAIIGLVIILRRYDTRLAKYPQILTRLSLMSENEKFVKDIFSAHVVLQYSKLTDSVSDKMRNDIMPALLKSTNFVKTEFGLKEIDEALNGKGENPDWVKNNKINKKAEKKMHQMVQMQMEGADVYMTTFRYLKSHSFFKTMENWFKPFSFDEPEINSAAENKIIQKILKATPFCDSDKYSFIFMINGMGANGAEMLTSQITEQLPDDMTIDEVIRDEENEQEGGDTLLVKTMRKYAQDLYRFFNLYECHNQFLNPFDANMSNFVPLNRNTFKCFVDNDQNYEHLLNLAEFMMRKELYQDSLLMFTFVKAHQHSSDADLWQKIGFCQQKTKQYDEALESLLIADSISQNSHWNALHISQVAFEVRDFDTAIKYLKQLMEEEPENVKYILKTAECYFGKDDYSQATPLLYKATYLDEKSLSGHQMLAWALLMTKSYLKAENEYRKCVELGDYSSQIGLGHVFLAEKDRSKAFEECRNAYHTYLSIASTPEDAKDAFEKDFWKDTEYLMNIGVDRSNLMLLYNATVLTNL